MENPNFLAKRMVAVLKSAILGALASDGLILLTNFAHHMWRQGQLTKFWHDVSAFLAYLLAIPAALITPEGSNPPNAYIVNGLMGAFIFAFITAFWQFLVKRNK